ncbi:YheC/YheD family protein [Salipaludibacillus aurantiacus]|uniref:YheC/D like ATP-grasp n=1 Tax=Salipaludibacillus aurantiacus TaxID=1601833 RepID=A0A1H9UNM8_9BACI|nr:YheC/YheD family protein [Salipaludibacillus aurantiacus]SES10804.1 YheC/D like ATP-grasp [Salipaludibacillus aurantiacus]
MASQDKSHGYLGVLISNRAWRAIIKEKPHYRLQQLAEANKRVNLKMYLFSIKQVDLKTQTIIGYYFDTKDGLWKIDMFPYPDVLYRRGGPPKRYKHDYTTFLNQCEKRQTLYLNPSTLGNWEIYNYFGTVERLQPYLMETLLYKEPEDLFRMLEKHKTIYLKGVTGRKGQQVVRVETLPDYQYACKFFDHIKNSVNLTTYETMDDMLPFIQSFYKGKEFMVQEAIDLLEVKGRRLDLRAELQRNRKGEIEISGISARMSQKNSPITIHSQAFPLNKLLEMLDISLKRKSEIKKEIDRFLIVVYEDTEKKYGKFAEIGIDFALTKNLQIKFIECNSQSAKVSLIKAYGEKTLNRALSNILFYARYLLNEKLEEKGLTEAAETIEEQQDTFPDIKGEDQTSGKEKQTAEKKEESVFENEEEVSGKETDSTDETLASKKDSEPSLPDSAIEPAGLETAASSIIEPEKEKIKEAEGSSAYWDEGNAFKEPEQEDIEEEFIQQTAPVEEKQKIAEPSALTQGSQPQKAEKSFNSEDQGKTFKETEKQKKPVAVKAANHSSETREADQLKQELQEELAEAEEEPGLIEWTQDTYYKCWNSFSRWCRLVWYNTEKKG